METSFMSPDKVIEKLDIRPNQVIADFGAGHGFFSTAFAKKVGPSGQVFAIDILPEAIEAIQSRARLEGFFNIKAIRGNLEKSGSSGLDDNSCDLVFAANILFQNPDRTPIIKEAHRILKPQGRFIVVEWHSGAAVGPSTELRIDETDLKSICASQDFQFSNNLDAGAHHYGLVFIKP